jgi:hypothetical protein
MPKPPSPSLLHWWKSLVAVFKILYEYNVGCTSLFANSGKIDL